MVLDFIRSSDFDSDYNMYKEMIRSGAIDLELFNDHENVKVDTIDDDYGEDTIYSLSSIPFEMMHQLETSLYNSLHSGIL